MKVICCFLVLLLYGDLVLAQSVINYSINTDIITGDISPYIYGANVSAQFSRQCSQ